MTEFVALRPKLYSNKKLGGSKTRNAKESRKALSRKPLRIIRPAYSTILQNIGLS